ncbi:MAG: type III secretion protein [Myxococcaceae bacterium]
MRLRLSRLGVLLVVAAFAAGCQENLQHNLNEDDANDIYALLSESGISAKKLKEESGNEPTYVISVPRQEYPAAVKLLREHSLPRPMQKGFKGIGESKGMVPTQNEDRAMFLEATQGVISNSLNKVPGVLEARVIINIPEKNDLTQPNEAAKPTGSVFVKYRVGMDGRPPITENEVKGIVANGVEKLEPGNVFVVMRSATAAQDVNQEGQFVQVLGIRVAKTSASEFKIMILAAGLLILAMTVVTVWIFLRSGSSSNAPSKVRRTRPPEA